MSESESALTASVLAALSAAAGSTGTGSSRCRLEWSRDSRDLVPGPACPGPGRGPAGIGNRATGEAAAARPGGRDRHGASGPESGLKSESEL